MSNEKSIIVSLPSFSYVIAIIFLMLSLIDFWNNVEYELTLILGMLWFILGNQFRIMKKQEEKE